MELLVLLITKWILTPISSFRHFADINNKATDETWYKRAVDYHKIDSDAFVYSIPFDVGEKPTTVTATHSIMVGKGPQKAPVAVVGMQIDYDTFYDVFMNTTSRVGFQTLSFLYLFSDQNISERRHSTI